MAASKSAPWSSGTDPIAPGAIAAARITQVARQDWGRILAALVRILGDITLAEDSLQDAVIAALDNWSRNGLPAKPDAWLLTVARRKALDRLRRDANFARKSDEIAYLQSLEASTPPDDAMDLIPDKRLELIFTCCHPAIEEKSRIALTLRALGGLTTAEIAAAFLDKPDAMAARLTRAKRKITDAGIPFRLPEPDDLPARAATVQRVIYLIYNEGYRPNAADAPIRADLTGEAIRLARMVVDLMPADREARGLLALMLLHESRRTARTDANGALVLLEDQDRSLWDGLLIDKGKALLKTALGPGAGPYAIQAAISAIHAEAASFEATDWPQIAALYEMLHAMEPNPVIRINQAIALSQAGNPAAGLAMLDSIGDAPRFARYQPFFAARADILARIGRAEQAAADYAMAISLSPSDAEREALVRRRAARLGAGMA